MRVPDKGPQSLETTEFSKLIILLWSMPQRTSALTGSSMPTSFLHLQPDLARFPWSMPTNARALQTCNSNSTFFQDTNRGRGGTTLLYSNWALGAHTQAELVSLSCSPARTQREDAMQRVPQPEPSLSFPLHFSHMQKRCSWPWFLLPRILFKYSILLFSVCDYIKHCHRVNSPKSHMLSLQERLLDLRRLLALSVSACLGHLHNQHWPSCFLPFSTFCQRGSGPQFSGSG